MKPKDSELTKVGFQAANLAANAAASVAHQVTQVTQQVVEAGEKVSPYKLQGKLRIAFWVMISCIAAVMGYAVFRIQVLFNEEALIQKEYNGIEHYTDQMAASMSFGVTQISIFVASGQISYLQKGLDYINTHTTPHFESLQSLTLASGINTDRRLTSIEADYSRLKYEINNLDDLETDKKRNYLVTVLLPITQRIALNCDDLADEYESKSVLQTQSLQEQIKNLYWQFGIFFVIVLVVALYWSRNALQSLIAHIHLVREYISTLQKGDLPTSMVHTRDEFNDIILDVEQLTEQLRGIKKFANEVREGNFNDEVSTFFNNGELGEALTQMRLNLRNMAEQERDRHWINQGTSLIGDTTRRYNDNISTLCDAVLERLINYIGCHQGGIFIQSENSEQLVMEACYAYGRKKFTKKTIEKGEGLIGEVARDAEILYMTDIPPHYLDLSSGLGESAPSSLVIVPLKTQDAVVGVMELASFGHLNERQLTLLDRSAAILASVIGNVITTQRTARLLVETRESAERMNAQEEELRQNTEELLATREELEKQLEITRAQLAVQAHFVDDNSCAVIITNEQGAIEILNNNAVAVFGFSRNELKGLPISRLIPQLSNLSKHAREDKLQVSFSEAQAFRKDRKSVDLLISVSKIEIGQSVQYALTVGVKA